MNPSRNTVANMHYCPETEPLYWPYTDILLTKNIYTFCLRLSAAVKENRNNTTTCARAGKEICSLAFYFLPSPCPFLYLYYATILSIFPEKKTIEKSKSMLLIMSYFYQLCHCSSILSIFYSHVCVKGCSWFLFVSDICAILSFHVAYAVMGKCINIYGH